MGTTRTPDDESRIVRIGQILSDFHDRKARGETVSEAELLAAHPDLADELRQHLETLGNLQPAHDQFERLIAQGVLAKSDDPAYRASLGAYKTIEFIGRGGMGIVLKAYEEGLNRIVALKILRPEFAEDDLAVKRFAREAKAAGTLRHGNIVTVYAVGREQGSQFLAMEYIEGPTLAEVISEQGPLPADTIRRLFRELLKGLEAAHDAGLIHRDIKSANILLDGSQQQVKIADFGLARMMVQQTRITLPDSALGTPEYMSPEQARGDDDIDHRADLYSAGVVLYEMLTGRTPFRADTPSTVIHRILHEEPTDPRTLNEDADPHLASLAMRLMAKRPNDRFASADQVIEALQHGGRVTLLHKRRRLIRRVGIVLVLVGAVWLLSLIARSGDPPSIAQVDIARDPAGDNTLVVLARRQGQAEFGVFFDEFPEEMIKLECVSKVDLDGQGRQLIVAGTKRVDKNGASLWGLPTWDEDPWRIKLAPETRWDWPDCSEPTFWRCPFVVAADLDGEPGDELVVVGTENEEYPSRISVVDPRTQEIRSTFWHMGDMCGVLIVQDFFDGKRPAIVAWANNNKLDGFGDPAPRPYTCLAGEDPPMTNWDVVTIMMVLDPAQMDGLGPPRTDRLPIEPAPGLYAYVFLDLPYTASILDVSEPTGTSDGTMSRPFEEMGAIMGVDWRRGADGVQAGRFGVTISVSDKHDNMASRAVLKVNRDLELVEVTSINVGGEREGTNVGYWHRFWRHVIRRGRTVRES